ncbi:MAG: NAD(P)H-hydrate dehydratase [Acidobacteriota bacterium]|nr:NAD(P)H-hydrate dehydratase [Acidobacteriota bacterium]
MLPILSSAEMREADAREVARRGQAALVADAGTAVALTAKSMLGSCYGRRVAVIAGPGLNGADGRVAASWLSHRGARVRVLDVGHEPAELVGYDLVIDAAFGLGCTRAYDAPRVGSTPVLALDLVSGVDADTGRVFGRSLAADVTLALGALKYAHVTGPAAELAGEVRLATLSIPCTPRDGVMEDADLAGVVVRSRDDHKWSHAVAVLAGSDLMPGAAALVCEGALAAGASMIRLTSRGDVATLSLPVEVVRTSDADIDARCRAVVAGPGLGAGAPEWLEEPLATTRAPVVLDADGLDRDLIARRAQESAWILTPHAGEFARLGAATSSDRLADVRALAFATGCVVLLKGPRTIVAAPDGRTRVVNAGTPALATAGSGDVLGGIIGALLAYGHDALSAAALGAHLHGRAGARLALGASALAGEVESILARN